MGPSTWRNTTTASSPARNRTSSISPRASVAGSAVQVPKGVGSDSRPLAMSSGSAAAAMDVAASAASSRPMRTRRLGRKRTTRGSIQFTMANPWAECKVAVSVVSVGQGRF